MRPTFQQSARDNSQIMKVLKAHPTRILKLYANYLLQGYHRKVDRYCKTLGPKHFKVNTPVLFNQKRTCVLYSHKWFNFGVIQEIGLHRNSTCPRTISIGHVERGNIKVKAINDHLAALVQTPDPLVRFEKVRKIWHTNSLGDQKLYKMISGVGVVCS